MPSIFAKHTYCEGEKFDRMNLRAGQCDLIQWLCVPCRDLCSPPTQSLSSFGLAYLTSCYAVLYGHSIDASCSGWPTLNKSFSHHSICLCHAIHPVTPLEPQTSSHTPPSSLFPVPRICLSSKHSPISLYYHCSVTLTSLTF